MPTSNLSLRMESAVRPALPGPLSLPGTSWGPRVVALKLGGWGCGGLGAALPSLLASLSRPTRGQRPLG